MQKLFRLKIVLAAFLVFMSITTPGVTMEEEVKGETREDKIARLNKEADVLEKEGKRKEAVEKRREAELISYASIFVNKPKRAGTVRLPSRNLIQANRLVKEEAGTPADDTTQATEDAEEEAGPLDPDTPQAGSNPQPQPKDVSGGNGPLVDPTALTRGLGRLKKSTTSSKQSSAPSTALNGDKSTQNPWGALRSAATATAAFIGGKKGSTTPFISSTPPQPELASQAEAATKEPEVTASSPADLLREKLGDNGLHRAMFNLKVNLAKFSDKLGALKEQLKKVVDDAARAAEEEARLLEEAARVRAEETEKAEREQIERELVERTRKEQQELEAKAEAERLRVEEEADRQKAVVAAALVLKQQAEALEQQKAQLAVAAAKAKQEEDERARRAAEDAAKKTKLETEKKATEEKVLAEKAKREEALNQAKAELTKHLESFKRLAADKRKAFVPRINEITIEGVAKLKEEITAAEQEAKEVQDKKLALKTKLTSLPEKNRPAFVNKIETIESIEGVNILEKEINEAIELAEQFRRLDRERDIAAQTSLEDDSDDNEEDPMDALTKLTAKFSLQNSPTSAANPTNTSTGDKGAQQQAATSPTQSGVKEVTDEKAQKKSKQLEKERVAREEKEKRDAEALTEKKAKLAETLKNFTEAYEALAVGIATSEALKLPLLTTDDKIVKGIKETFNKALDDIQRASKRVYEEASSLKEERTEPDQTVAILNKRISHLEGKTTSMTAHRNKLKDSLKAQIPTREAALAGIKTHEQITLEDHKQMATKEFHEKLNELKAQFDGEPAADLAARKAKRDALLRKITELEDFGKTGEILDQIDALKVEEEKLKAAAEESALQKAKDFLNSLFAQKLEDLEATKFEGETDEALAARQARRQELLKKIAELSDSGEIDKIVAEIDALKEEEAQLEEAAAEANKSMLSKLSSKVSSLLWS